MRMPLINQTTVLRGVTFICTDGKLVPIRTEPLRRRCLKEPQTPLWSGASGFYTNQNVRVIMKLPRAESELREFSIHFISRATWTGA